MAPLHQPLLERAGPELERPAILWRGGVLSHGELRQRVLSFARQLQRDGVAPGDRVAIALPKGPEAVVAILGTLTAGAVYVPVDTAQPPARAAAIVADAEPAVVVTSASGPLFEPAGPGDRHELPRVDPDQAAAILYTSGTTGDPKGIVLSHRNIGSFVEWAIGRFDLGPDDRYCGHARFHFDLSTLDLFAPVATGASVYLLDEGVLAFPSVVTRLVEDARVTVWYATPSMFRLVTDHGGLDRRDLSALRWIFFAGEVYPAPALRRLMERLRGPGYVNLYGPTETNVCTYHVLETLPEPDEGPVPIGMPREDLSVEVIDTAGGLLGPHQPGEIAVAGPAVMMGYWRRPDLTMATRRSGRSDSYRTGDIGRCDGLGRLHFLGRRDHQVKVHGHRLELLEVERRLAEHPHVVSTAVVATGEPGETTLVAFVVATPPAPDVTALRRHCARALPAWAVPARFIFVSDLPLTSTGKVDRQRLTGEAIRESLPSSGG